MQLKGVPFDLDVVFFPQRIDPSLADVAKRSNEVRENVDGYRHFHSFQSTGSMSACFQHAFEGRRFSAPLTHSISELNWPQRVSIPSAMLGQH
jgi:hypothetical protein